jgi:hypothetical protein
MSGIRVVTWPRGGESLIVQGLQAALGARAPWLAVASDRDDGSDPAALPPGARLVVEHEEFPEAVALRFAEAVAGGHPDGPDAFRRFASEEFGRFLDFMEQWGDPEAPDGRLVVPRAALRADPAPWLAWASGALDPALLLEGEALGAAAAHLAGLAAAHPAPALPGFVDEALARQLGELRLRREVVRETFQALMRRTPEDRAVLNLQRLASPEALETALRNSPEYLAKQAGGPQPFGEAELRLAYRLLLGREIGREELQRLLAQGIDATSLREAVLRSDEFARAYAAIRPNPPSARPGTGQSLLPAPSLADLRPHDEGRVVFLHLPKCGGTTLHHVLEGWYGRARLHEERFNRLYRRDMASLASRTVFSGHFDFYSTQCIPGPRTLISVMRDPLERLVSLYNFHRAHDPEAVEAQNLALPRWAIEHDIDAYFLRPEIRAHGAIDNSMVRHFSDVPQIGGPLGRSVWKGITIEDMLDQALANLERFAFVAFLDRYDADVARLAAVLGQTPPETVVPQQVLDNLMASQPGMRRIEKQRPGPATLAAMEDLVRHDRILFARAREIFAPAEAQTIPAAAREASP